MTNVQDNLMHLRPRSIKLDKQRQILVVDWHDGSSAEYSWNSLRDACPCAQCRNEYSAENTSTTDMVFNLNPVKSFSLDLVELAGNYALKLYWSDGHNSGIYGWEYLKTIDSSTT